MKRHTAALVVLCVLSILSAVSFAEPADAPNAGVRPKVEVEPTPAPATTKEGERVRKRAEKAAPSIAVVHNLVIAVADRDAAADTIVAAAENAGGYFTSRTDDSITLKLPSRRVKAALTVVEKQGRVMQRGRTAEDVAPRLLKHRTLLRSRKDVLKRYFAVLKGARPGAVVTVEREMTSLVGDIESLSGAIRLLQHRLDYAEVRVAFQFRDRRPPLRDGSSSFQWLNTMNLVDLHEEFARDSF